MNFLTANWHAPKFVRACTTTLSNLEHPNDYNLCLKNTTNPSLTLENRAKVKEHFGLKTEPAWLNQIHSNKCIPIPEEKNNEADASFTRNSQQGHFRKSSTRIFENAFCKHTDETISARSKSK